jgi:hypothetical protein
VPQRRTINGPNKGLWAQIRPSRGLAPGDALVFSDPHDFWRLRDRRHRSERNILDLLALSGDLIGQMVRHFGSAWSCKRRSALVRVAASFGLLASIGFLTALPATALDRRVEIINNTGFTIVEFYGSNAGSKSWEEDILGPDLLPPGSSVVVNFDDASGFCKFDFRAVFDDGEALERRGINICEIATFTYE